MISTPIKLTIVPKIILGFGISWRKIIEPMMSSTGMVEAIIGALILGDNERPR